VRSDFDTFGEATGESIILTAGAFLELGEERQCELDAQFFESRFIRDSPDTLPEISIVGGESGGSDNHAVVEIARATVETSDGIPVEGALLIEDGAASNTARLAGSRDGFIRKNQGLPAPPAQFFLEP
jgi:hypothetical protein